MHGEDQQSRLLLAITSLLSAAPLPPPPSPPRSPQHAPAPSPARISSFLLGASLAMVLGGSMTFLVGCLLLPWVIGFVMVHHLVGVVANLSELGRAVLCRRDVRSTLLQTFSFSGAKFYHSPRGAATYTQEVSSAQGSRVFRPVEAKL